MNKKIMTHIPWMTKNQSIRREPKRQKKGRRADDLRFQDAVNDSIIVNWPS